MCYKSGMSKILNRYILKEIGFPFIMTVFIFTFVLLIGKILQIMEMVVNKGISFFDIALLILFILPSFLTFTMPISFLIAILIGLGRLSGDNEITVLRASGVSLYQLIYPILIAAGIVCFLTAATGLFAPVSNQASKNLLFAIVQQKAGVGIKERIFNDDFQGLVLYTDRIAVKGDRMEGILISDTRLAGEPTTIIAKQGYLVSNPRSMKVTLRLMDGSIHAVDSSLNKYKKTDFSSYDINLDLQSIAADRGAVRKGSVDMTIGELRRNMKRTDLNPNDRRDMVIEFHKKFSIPLSCFVFAFIAVPFGMVGRRSGKSRGFTVGLLIVVVYYTLQLAGEALGETGKVPPALAVWAPDTLLGAFAFFLFMLSAGDRSIGILTRPEWVGRISDRFKRRKP